MKKVIYIAFNFNDDNGIALKRLRGVSKYLPSFGWQPIVIVPRTSNKTAKIDNVRVVETDYQDMISRFLPNSKSDTDEKKEVDSKNQSNKF